MKNIGSDEVVQRYVKALHSLTLEQNKDIKIKGVAHITGGGLVENIPRILPDECGVKIQKGSWPSLPVFDVMQSIGDVDENEMFRAFNMGVGMVFIVDQTDVYAVKSA